VASKWRLMRREGYVTTTWEQRNAYRILVGTDEGKALLYLSQDEVQRLAADSSQHGLSSGWGTWRQQSARSVSEFGQVAGSSQQSAWSVSGCGQ
jgi:hypothetical protein